MPRDGLPDRVPVNAAPALMRRAALLARQLEQDIASVLRTLGTAAYGAFLHHARRQIPDTAERRASLVQRILEALGIRTWLARHLRPILANHASRVIADTGRTLTAEVARELHELRAPAPLPSHHGTPRLDLHVPPDDARTIINGAGKDLRLPDIEPQARRAILSALEDGYYRGENPVATARRIQQYVPAGRFVHAGARYRARLIARTETLNMQRASTLAAYRSQPSVVAVRISDGVLSDSDDACRARNGREVPISQIGTVQAMHPQCTLSFSPIITTRITVPEIEPERMLIAA